MEVANPTLGSNLASVIHSQPGDTNTVTTFGGGGPASFSSSSLSSLSVSTADDDELDPDDDLAELAPRLAEVVLEAAAARSSASASTSPTSASVSSVHLSPIPSITIISPISENMRAALAAVKKRRDACPDITASREEWEEIARANHVTLDALIKAVQDTSS